MLTAALRRQCQMLSRPSPRLANVLAHQRRSIIILSESKYTAEATAEGAGRNGRVKSHGDAALDLKLASPKALGGSGDGQNPEQLFAMGYASCFLGALQLVASKAGKKDIAKNAKIHASVHLGTPEGLEGFGIGVDIKVEGVDDDALIKAAHEFCPYSRALTQGAHVNVSKA